MTNEDRGPRFGPDRDRRAANHVKIIEWGDPPRADIRGRGTIEEEQRVDALVNQLAARMGEWAVVLEWPDDSKSKKTILGWMKRRGYSGEVVVRKGESVYRYWARVVEKIETPSEKEK